MIAVHKYGGTSVADDARILAAAQRTVRFARQGWSMVVVVSAQGDTTDALAQMAARLSPDASQREMDAVLSAGEQISAGLMAMAISSLGCPAVSLTGWQAGIETDGVHGNARILGLCNDRIRRELAQGKIVVVAGFQGIGPNGDITTLGRGGSDTTAVALAALLGADSCRIYTDVDGVYDRDPRRFPGATRYPRISYDAMLQLIEGGAQVLHSRCVETARDRNMEIEVLSAFTGAPGTVVGAMQ